MRRWDEKETERGSIGWGWRGDSGYGIMGFIIKVEER